MNIADLSSLNKRVILFVLISVLTSGIVGPTLLSDKLLHTFHFSVYENILNFMLLWILLFIVINRINLKKLNIEGYKRENTIFLLSSTLLVVMFFHVIGALSRYSSFSENLPLSILAHIIVFMIPAFIFLGIFGYKFFISLITQFHKKIALTGVTSLLSILILVKINSSWQFLSNLALIIIKYLLGLSSIISIIIPPTTLVIDGFIINIGQTCSGIESIFLFSILYILISAFEWEKFNKRKIILLYIPSIIGLFILNIFRIYLLIINSLFISPDFSLQTLHTYLGLIFFVLYFSLFWRFSYKWMKK